MLTWNPGPVVQYSLGVIFCYWIFLFSCSKASDANIGMIANFVYFVKTPNNDVTAKQVTGW